MSTKEARQRATAKYHKKMKQLIVAFSPNEMDVWDFLAQQDNKSGFVKGLIRREMERGKQPEDSQDSPS